MIWTLEPWKKTKLKLIALIEKFYISAWYDPVTIEVYSNIDANFNSQRPTKSPFISIQGRLKLGKLNGFVFMQGRMTADPKSVCSSTSFEGIGFIGYYEAGKTVGIGWRGLFGTVGNGAWIYGETDGQGTFTGEQFLVFLQTFLILFKWTFSIRF